jgi:glycerophosphoryl diester phosphodiesterase
VTAHPAAPGQRAALKRVAHGVIRAGVAQDAIASSLEAGVDMVEIDVIGPPWSSRLVVAHDLREIPAGSSFDDALATLAARLPPGIEINVDLKLPGYEQAVVAAVERHGLLERSLVSTMEEGSLALLRERWPQIRLGWSVPRLQRDPLRNPVVAGPAFVLMHYMRVALPSVAANRIRRGEIDALMAHWRLATPRLARSISDAGGELYAWTVDDRRRIAGLERMGVTGVISNDPRLFGARATS